MKNWKINNSYNGTLIDAKQRNKEHPNSFLLEDESKLLSLAIGDFVKIGLECNDTNVYAERFWVQICCINLDRNEIIGCVDNDLVNATNYCLKYKDYIRFSIENIMSIYKV